MANIYSEKEFKELMTNYYSTKGIKDLLKEVKKYLKEGKKDEELCELIGGASCDKYLFGNDEIIHIIIEKTRFIDFTPYEYDIKIQQDEKSINIFIDYETKEIKADTKCFIEYKDGSMEKDYYEIAHINF